MKMLENIKDSMYLAKMILLQNKGLAEGRIVPFDEELYDQMSHTFINYLPVSMHIKYFKPILFGKCLDRSLYMFFCFEESLLVRGNTRDLEIRDGKDKDLHGWIEIGDYVYDPANLLRYEKELYYKIYSPKAVERITKEEYNEINNGYYDEVRRTTISDFQIGGAKRADLASSILLAQAFAEHNESFKEELNEYLELIQYDEKQVFNELFSSTKRSLSKPGADSITG